MYKKFFLPFLLAFLLPSSLNAVPKVNCNSSVWKDKPQCEKESKGYKTTDDKTGLDVVEFVVDIDWKSNKRTKIPLSKIVKISSALGYDTSTASIIRVGLLHEIGKVGDINNDYFLEQDSDWHREKLGQMYKYNENLPKMTVSHRTLYLLQSYGVTLTREEWEAIATSQGHHLDENKFYAYSKEPLTKLLHAEIISPFDTQRVFYFKSSRDWQRERVSLWRIKIV